MPQSVAAPKERARNQIVVYAKTVFPIGMDTISMNQGSCYGFQIGKCSSQLPGRRDSPFDEAFQLGQLAGGYCSLQFAHAIVQREEFVIRVLIFIAPPFINEQVNTASEIRIVRSNQPPFSARDVLSLLKTKASDPADGSDGASAM